ncbi:MAG: dihydrodipicolinate reductase C-terminal domain-containing protein, partial [Crocinitomicaceae bacterium]|nr:dihydrodipicolinate reductase C-terminal domain-containing protein [Crocinitomicaceae bacterium]
AYDYKPSITEIHHTEKLDIPSGTAITMVELILEELKSFNKTEDGEYIGGSGALPVHSKRVENVPGTHEVRFSSDIDELTLTHKAHNRKGFALGAVIAAEWIQNKKGLFTMSDVLNLK